MKYLHTMVRVTDLDQSLRFYCDALGLRELRRYDNAKGRFTLVFLAAPGDDERPGRVDIQLGSRAVRHRPCVRPSAYQVDDIYAACRRLQEHGVTINRPPRDGRMAFVRSPDNISVELLQKGDALPAAEPWVSMPNTGSW